MAVNIDVDVDVDVDVVVVRTQLPYGSWWEISMSSWCSCLTDLYTYWCLDFGAVNGVVAIVVYGYYRRENVDVVLVLCNCVLRNGLLITAPSVPTGYYTKQW